MVSPGGGKGAQVEMIPESSYVKGKPDRLAGRKVNGIT
jgi:hypothetical protein